MSDTPRTDEQEGSFPFGAERVYYVPADFSRELERENAALRADKERLDWLTTTEGSDGDRDHPYFRRSRTIGAILDDGDVDTIRDAIDKARGLPYKRPLLDHFDY